MHFFPARLWSILAKTEKVVTAFPAPQEPGIERTIYPTSIYGVVLSIQWGLILF